jgi:hypothetical protein
MKEHAMFRRIALLAAFIVLVAWGPNRHGVVGPPSSKNACADAGIASEFRGNCFASNHQATGDVFRPNRPDHRFSLLQRAACGSCFSQH